MKVAIVTIGDEILIGQVVDTNSAWLGSNLAERGISVVAIDSISDTAEAIQATLEKWVGSVDAILCTGGLGPTKDDITKKAIADFFKMDMAFHQETYDRIADLFAKYGRKLQDSHRHQCLMPVGARLLVNRMGTAPGMVFNQDDTMIISMPGVPYEMKAIMNDHGFHLLEALVSPEAQVYSRTIMTAGEGESYLEQRISDILKSLPPYISIAYLPSLGSVRIRVTGKGKRAIIQPQVDQAFEQIKRRISEFVYGIDNISITQALMELCKNKGLKIGTAESCTGGYVSHRITSDPGSSHYYEGSIISYSNNLKMNLLKVQPSTLETHGAVSEATVIEMAQGAINALDVDIAVSISGIAGPSGGSPEKPVGTIWMCIASCNQQYVFRLNATKDRAKNIEYAGNLALNNLRKFILKHY